MAKHPKTLRLAKCLKCERRYAVGLLHDLFTWGLDAAKKDGTLPNLGAEEIAAALDFTGKKGASVVAALVECGYLELTGNVYKIHDWYDYAGKLADKREDDKRRKKEQREREQGKEDHRTEHGSPADVTRTSGGNPLVTVPNRTVPNKEGVGVGVIRAREDDTDEPPNDLARVMRFFQDRINTTPSPMCIEYLKSYTESLGADVVLHACEIAIDERKPNWSYIQGILRRYEQNDLRTLDAVLQAEADFNRRRQEQKKKKKKERRVTTFMDV